MNNICEKLLNNGFSYKIYKEHDFFSLYHWRIQKPELNFEYKIYW